jgi:hypothetical protein
VIEDYEHVTYLLELFQLGACEFIDWIKKQSFGVYVPEYSERVGLLLPKIRGRMNYFSLMLELDDCVATNMERNGQSSLISPHDLSTKQFYVFGRKNAEFKVTFRKADDVSFKDASKNIPRILDHFLYAGLRKSLPKGMKSEGSIVYDPSVDLLSERKIFPASPLLEDLGVHPAVSVAIDKYSDKIYLHVSPTTRLLSKRSLRDFLNYEGTEKLAREYIKYVRLALGRTAEIREITQTTADAPIDTPAFGKRNFLQFAEDNYHNVTLNDPKAKLAVVLPFGLSNPWIFSTEAMYPSFTFRTIDAIDPRFLNSLLGIVRARSIERLENAKKFVKEMMAFTASGCVIEVCENPYSSKILVRAPFLKDGKLDETNLWKLPETENGAMFETPSISLRMSNKKGEFNEKTIYPDIDGLRANLNDLMGREDLAPLEIQPEINVAVIIDEKLAKKWQGKENDFENAVLHGVKSAKNAYRGFEQTFKCRLNIVKRFTVSDFFGDEFETVAKQISPLDYDCVLLVIPRWLETSELSKKIYVTPKEKIMQKGIPVQVITDDERRVKGSLQDKMRDPFVIFGLSLNIAAKPGSRLTAFSEEFAERIIGNSVVVGYNVTRIMPKSRRLEQAATIEELAGKTFPLVAPLFIIDNRGSRVLHWDFYQPTSEVSLFSEFGDKIFEKIKGNVDNIVVHKDGPFKEAELEDLAGFSTSGRRIIPISITHSSSPRMHNAMHVGVGSQIQRGVFLKLDQQHYELATTTIASWKAESWGWPRPILIELHGSLDYRHTLRLLYQIFGLTKMHFGSQRPTRSPISIHYANLVSTFLRALGDEAPSFHQSFARVFIEKGRMPLWFL